MRANRRIRQSEERFTTSSRDAKERRQPLLTPEASEAPGVPLDGGARAFLEPRLGHDLSGVRIVNDDRADRAARALNARAFTIGEQIFFRSGEFNPRSNDGLRLLAHEATHVSQQRAGQVAAPPAGEYVVSAASDPLEAAADRHADAVMRGEAASVGAAANSTATSSSRPVGLVQRQVADPALDASAGEPLDNRIVVDGAPSRDGQMSLQQFLERVERSLTQVVFEVLGQKPDRFSGSMDSIAAIVADLSAIYGRESTKSATVLEDLLRREYPEEYERRREERLGPEHRMMVFTGSADLLFAAIEERARQRAERFVREELHGRADGESSSLGAAAGAPEPLESSDPEASARASQRVACGVVMEFWLSDGAVADKSSLRFLAGRK